MRWNGSMARCRLSASIENVMGTTKSYLYVGANPIDGVKPLVQRKPLETLKGVWLKPLKCWPTSYEALSESDEIASVSVTTSTSASIG